MKVCPKCSARNQDYAVVCKSCGASLGSVAITEEKEEVYTEEKKPYHLGLSFLFSFLALISSTVKELFPVKEDAEGFKTSNFYIYLLSVAVGVVFAILAVRCLRGLFAKKPLPLMGIFAIMLCVAAFAVLAFDLVLTIFYVIPDMIRILS